MDERTKGCSSKVSICGPYNAKNAFIPTGIAGGDKNDPRCINCEKKLELIQKIGPAGIGSVAGGQARKQVIRQGRIIMKLIISSSFGKDSTAMIHLLRERNESISNVIYFDTGWDFPQMEAHIQKVEKNTGIKTIRIRNYRHFDELLGRYGWPHPKGGWCAASKRDNCNKIIRALKGTVECIGFTTNEIHRTTKPTIQKKKWQVRFPLIEYGLSERDTLKYCYSLGYDWNGLYDVFSRISCFCCPKAGQKRIDKLKIHFPELYNNYLKLDRIVNDGKTAKKENPER